MQKAPWHALLVAAALCVDCVEAANAPASQQEERTQQQAARLFFRIVGAQNNAPILPKTRSAWTQDRQVRTGTTGMSDLGFTEYPFCSGRMDFCFVEQYAYYPRLLSGAQADRRRVNTADIVLEHVYQPDGCVWGREGKRFVQTFTATRRELVSATLLVASEPGTFRAALIEGGPGGRQIGPAKTFVSGHSMTWGSARWNAGEAPLVPGRTYGIRIERTDGKVWTPYLHSTGNAYDGGLLYVDGVPRPESDLAAWILEEPPDLRRALIEGADPDGWVYDRRRVAFVPRTPNVRLISLSVTPVTADELGRGHADLVCRVYASDGRRIAGPKRCLAAAPPGALHVAHFLFAADECPVRPGGRYLLDVYTVPHGQEDLPEDQDAVIVPRDVQARVYGEPQPGSLPGIYNLRVNWASDSGFQSDSRLRLSWSAPFPAPTVVETWGPGVNDGKQTDVPAGTTDVVIRKFWPGHEYDFRLTSTGPTGLRWSTPRYRVRIPRTDEIGPLRQPQYPPQFVTLAPARLANAPEYGPLRYQRQVAVANGDFEEGLAGWEVSGDEKIHADESQPGIGVKWGRKMAGFTHTAGDQRQQVFTKTRLWQKIATVPGHVYVLSAWALSSVGDGPRGDTRVRLFADPNGGRAFDGRNASQWYWTDGRWMRFEHRWTAAADRATIGLAFFRWRDLDRASAYVDHMTVYDLGPIAKGPDDPFDRTAGAPSLVLTDPKSEAADRVEAQLSAPPGYVITGIGARAHYDNLTTIWLRIQPLLPGGTLGKPEQLRGGWEPDAGLEAEVALPPGFIATGFGAAVAPEWDVKRLRVWARPLLPDGSLGEEKEFRGGVDLVSGLERQVRLAPGRVLTSAGLNCMLNDINGIRATSAVLSPTATAWSRARSGADR